MKVICIGAGASGLFFSLNSALYGNEVTILEGNEKAGKKIFITGKGRCNVTNNCSKEEFLNNVVTNSKFLYSAISKWDSASTISFFNDRNCELVIERGNRVFPKSYKAFSITDTLVKECKNNGVNIRYNTLVKECKKTQNGFCVITNKGIFECDALVIATGGKSYPLTGSKGDGYRFAESFGHHIITPRPALCPIKVKESFGRELINLTLKNVCLYAENEKFNHKEFGDLEFLPHALTGPIALTTSSLINKMDEVKLYLDFKPALSEETLDARFLREIKGNEHKKILDLIKGLFPSSIVNLFLTKLKIDYNKELNFFTKEERGELISLIKKFPFEFDGVDNISRAIVTSGGVDCKEVNPKTMESKICKNLYFIGEVLDLDAFTGGFNIQIAFTTAYSAATSIY